MTTALAPAPRAHRQTNALAALKAEPKGLTAPQLRDAIGLSGDTYGTRQTHALVRNLVEKGWVEKVAISDKIASEARIGTTGRKPKHRIKITGEGKKALKAAA